MPRTNARTTQNTQHRTSGVEADAFEALITLDAYPCLGAKSASKRGTLDYLRAGDLLDDGHDVDITRALQAFAARVGAGETFVSLAVLFPESPRLSELEFETALWQRLQAIHEVDREQHDWDPAVGNNPQLPHFSMSVGGRGFFVIGLHANASRLARRFHCPALVFNLHSQFEQLRAEGRYEKLRGAIVQRDVLFSGSSNPMLATYGERSEARQYSGRAVSEDWVCPFSCLPEGSDE